MNRLPTIGSAVIERLHQLGVRHIFGIPGDYVLSLYQLIEASPISISEPPERTLPGLQPTPMLVSMVSAQSV